MIDDVKNTASQMMKEIYDIKNHTVGSDTIEALYNILEALLKEGFSREELEDIMENALVSNIDIKLDNFYRQRKNV